MKSNILVCAVFLAIVSVPILTCHGPSLLKDNGVIHLRGLSDQPIEAIVKKYGKPNDDCVYPMKDNGRGGEMSIQLFNYYPCFPATKTPTGNEDIPIRQADLGSWHSQDRDLVPQTSRELGRTGWRGVEPKCRCFLIYLDSCFDLSRPFLGTP